ncbi:MAG: type II toxin-antitoxin system VapC family toxin [Thermodesulfobacteriota bacterium]
MVFSDLEEGASIFVDANIFIYHFSRESKANPASSDFLERIEKGSIRGFTSLPVIQEVIHRMMVIEAMVALPGVKSKDIVKYLKAHPDKVKELVNHQGVAIGPHRSGCPFRWHGDNCPA